MAGLPPERLAINARSQNNPIKSCVQSENLKQFDIVRERIVDQRFKDYFC